MPFTKSLRLLRFCVRNKRMPTKILTCTGSGTLRSRGYIVVCIEVDWDLSPNRLAEQPEAPYGACSNMTVMVRSFNSMASFASASDHDGVVVLAQEAEHIISSGFLTLPRSMLAISDLLLAVLHWAPSVLRSRSRFLANFGSLQRCTVLKSIFLAWWYAGLSHILDGGR